MEQKIGLIVDSGCDTTAEIRENMDIQIVPLTVIIGEVAQYKDDGSVNIANLLADMQRAKEASRSASPSLEDYCEAMRKYDECFVVTFSSKLSASHDTALIAQSIVNEEAPDKKIHVFDSKSASVGETELLLYLYEQITQNISFEKIVSSALEHIKNTRTLFVLRDLGNLIKNGRIKKLPGIISAALSIYPLLGDNGEGEIRFIGKDRGINKALNRLVDTVKEMTSFAEAKSRRLVLGHCNCLEEAEKLRKQLLEQCQALREVIIIPLGAVSTLYANQGGLIAAFRQ